MDEGPEESVDLYAEAAAAEEALAAEEARIAAATATSVDRGCDSAGEASSGGDSGQTATGDGAAGEAPPTESSPVDGPLGGSADAAGPELLIPGRPARIGAGRRLPGLTSSEPYSARSFLPKLQVISALVEVLCVLAWGGEGNASPLYPLQASGNADSVAAPGVDPRSSFGLAPVPSSCYLSAEVVA